MASWWRDEEMRTPRSAAGRIRTPLSVTLFAAALLAAAACVPPPTPPPPPPPSEAPVVSFEAQGAPLVAPALVPLAWKASDPQGDAISCKLDRNGDGVWDDTFDPCPSTASRNLESVAAGDHTARFEATDGTHTTAVNATYTVDPAASPEPMNIEIRPTGPVDADVVAAFDQAASRWEAAIVRGLSDMHVNVAPGTCGQLTAGADEVVDDLVVEIWMAPDDFPSAAYAEPCVYGPDGLPRYAYVKLNAHSLPDLRTQSTLDEVAVHELGHALGFGVAWTRHMGVVTGYASTDPRFVGPRALAEYSVLGRAGGGIPIMIINGVWQPHWESAFFREVMASVPDGAPLSRMTIASMADLGYSVDLGAADPYTPDLPAGTCITFSADIVRCW